MCWLPFGCLQRSPDGSVRILSINVGLLEVRILGRVVAEPVPFVRQRLEELPAAIAQQDADIVLIQEAFGDTSIFLCSQLAGLYQTVEGPGPRLLNGGSGLIIAARGDIRALEFVAFSPVDVQERIFTRKGVLLAEIDIGGWPRLTVANLHAPAGGFREPTSVQCEAWRSSALAQAIAALRLKRSAVRLLGGDFNCGPEVSPRNYSQVIDSGFADPVTQGGQPTWEPRNKLVGLGPHAGCPAQRIDHVFIDQLLEVRLSTARWSRVFVDDIVTLPSGDRVPLSDHYGSLYDFRLVG